MCDSLADSSIPMPNAKPVIHTADVLLICPDKITTPLPEGNKIIVPNLKDMEISNNGKYDKSNILFIIFLLKISKS